MRLANSLDFADGTFETEVIRPKYKQRKNPPPNTNPLLHRNSTCYYQTPSADPANAPQSKEGSSLPVCCGFWMHSPKWAQRARFPRDMDRRVIFRAPGKSSWRASFQATLQPRRAVARTSGTVSGPPGGCVTPGGSTTARSRRKMILKR